MTIYLDIVLIENLIMNSIIIYATAIIMKLKIKHLNILLSSIIGAIYSIMTYISNLKIYSNIFIKIILSIIMVYIAYKPIVRSNYVAQFVNDVLHYLGSETAHGG